MNIIKVVVIGPKKSGKTTWITRHLTGEFKTQYNATLGVEVHPIIFNGTEGNIRINVWDCAGDPKFGGLRSGYWLETDACIQFHSIDGSNEDINNEFNELYPDIPVVHVWNKVDIPSVSEEVISYITGLGIDMRPAFLISAKNNYNYEKPFLQVIKDVIGDEFEFSA